MIRGGVTLSARCARAHPVFGSDKCKDLCGHTQFLLWNVPEKDFVKPKKIWITSWLPWSFQCPICSLAERGCVIVRQNIPGLSWIFSFENQNKNKPTQRRFDFCLIQSFFKLMWNSKKVFVVKSTQWQKNMYFTKLNKATSIIMKTQKLCNLLESA